MGMNNHNPTSTELYALTRIAAVPGEAHPSDIPHSVLLSCQRADWIRQDADLHWWLTDHGRDVWEKRRA